MAHFRKKDFQTGLNRTEAKYLIEKKEGTYTLAKNKQTNNNNKKRKQIKSKSKQTNLPKEPKTEKRQSNPRNSKSTRT